VYAFFKEKNYCTKFFLFQVAVVLILLKKMILQNSSLSLFLLDALKRDPLKAAREVSVQEKGFDTRAKPASQKTSPGNRIAPLERHPDRQHGGRARCRIVHCSRCEMYSPHANGRGSVSYFVSMFSGTDLKSSGYESRDDGPSSVIAKSTQMPARDIWEVVCSALDSETKDSSDVGRTGTIAFSCWFRAFELPVSISLRSILNPYSSLLQGFSFLDFLSGFSFS